MKSKSPSVEFANAVAAEQKKGRSYDMAFAHVTRNRPDLVRGQKRSAFFRKVNSNNFRREFVNASDDFAANLFSALPQSIATVLGVNAATGDDVILKKIGDMGPKLSVAQQGELWTFVCNRVRWAKKLTSNTALAKAKALFPELAAAVDA